MIRIALIISLMTLSACAGGPATDSTTESKQAAEKTGPDSASSATTIVHSHIQKSLDHYAAGDFELSIQAANEALKLAPKSAIAYNNICSARVRLGEYDEAITACKKALEIVPRYGRAKANLEWACETAAERAPTVGALVELSLLRYQQGAYDKSIDAGRKALELDPNSAMVYSNICSAYAAKQEWDQAIEACEKALSIDPGHERARNNLDWARSGKAGG